MQYLQGHLQPQKYSEEISPSEFTSADRQYSTWMPTETAFSLEEKSRGRCSCLEKDIFIFILLKNNKIGRKYVDGAIFVFIFELLVLMSSDEFLTH